MGCHVHQRHARPIARHHNNLTSSATNSAAHQRAPHLSACCCSGVISPSALLRLALKATFVACICASVLVSASTCSQHKHAQWPPSEALRGFVGRIVASTDLENCQTLTERILSQRLAAHRAAPCCCDSSASHSHLGLTLRDPRVQRVASSLQLLTLLSRLRTSRHTPSTANDDNPAWCTTAQAFPGQTALQHQLWVRPTAGTKLLAASGHLPAASP